MKTYIAADRVPGSRDARKAKRYANKVFAAWRRVNNGKTPGLGGRIAAKDRRAVVRSLLKLAHH